MHAAVLLGLAMCATAPAEPAAPDPDRAAYEAARARAGRDADAHVKLALWCEAHGLGAERTRHLAIAVLTDPKHALARGLLGLVEFQGRWQRPDEVPGKVEADGARAALADEYALRRAKAAPTADSQWKLALWCEENGLKAESTAHLKAVVRLDPRRDAAWTRLGYRKHAGRWVTDAQRAGEKAEADLQKAADRRWRPLLATWKDALALPSRRADAERSLAGVTDPRAVPSIWAVFARGDDEDQARAVQLLGQIDAAGASRALAFLAVFSDSDEVRRVATESLRPRDPREFAGLLVALLRDPIKYQVRPVGGPGSPGLLVLDGKTAKVARRYAPPAEPFLSPLPGDRITYDLSGLPMIERQRHVGIGKVQITTLGSATQAQLLGMHSPDPAVEAALDENRGLRADGPRVPSRIALGASRLPRRIEQVTTTPNDEVTVIPIGQILAEYRKAAVAAQQQLASDVDAVEAYNADVTHTNDRLKAILTAVAGTDAGDRSGWLNWLADVQGFALKTDTDAPTPTYTMDVPLAYQPQQVPTASFQIPGQATTSIRIHHSCFGAGTPVRTLRGPKPIETIRVGDLVLTQNTRTGALGYQPVLAAYHNPPNATLRLALDGDSIVSTPIHRFWKAGKGWVMARDLKVGDAVRTLDGPARVAAIEAGKVQPVYNLDVADDDDFFVGAAGALAHDNSLPDLRLAPFDAEPALAAAGRGAD